MRLGRRLDVAADAAPGAVGGGGGGGGARGRPPTTPPTTPPGTPPSTPPGTPTPTLGTDDFRLDFLRRLDRRRVRVGHHRHAPSAAPRPGAGAAAAVAVAAAAPPRTPSSIGGDGSTSVAISGMMMTAAKMTTWASNRQRNRIPLLGSELDGRIHDVAEHVTRHGSPLLAHRRRHETADYSHCQKQVSTNVSVTFRHRFSNMVGRFRRLFRACFAARP